MDTISKGRLAEAKTITSLVEQGFEVYTPTFGNGSCDLIACVPDGHLLRFETKYTASQRRAERWDVSLKQTRPNRTGVITKMFNANQCEVLSVYVAPLDRVLFFEATLLHGRNSMVVKDDPAHYVVPIR